MPQAVYNPPHVKIYCPNTKDGQDAVGGGWTFLRNFKKAMANRVHFVPSWEECDVVFVTGVTMTDKEELFAASRAGKRIVLRVDNVPRKSRNRRQSPHERLREFADLADVVVYQSQWAKDYCSPLCGDGTVIHNGVDTEVFKPDLSKRPGHERYLFAYHGKSELKGFWVAHMQFQLASRYDPKAEFWFINDFGRETQELTDANFDFWNGERFEHVERQDSPERMAYVMQQCTHLLYPSVADSAPNVVLEARACGLTVEGYPDSTMSGTAELLDPNLDIGLERMGDEYLGVFELLANGNL